MKRPGWFRQWGLLQVGWLAAFLLPAAPALGQAAIRPRAADDLPTPWRTGEWQEPPGIAKPALFAEGALPIDLPTALRLAQTSNLDIAQARQTVQVARAALERARSQVLPSVTGGSTFVDHEGRIQQAVGNILNSNRNSLFVGGGQSVAFQFSEAIFTTLAARQVVDAAQAGVQRVTNDTLLTVAEAYFTVLRARRRLARAEETLVFLTSDQPAESRGKSKGLLPLIRDFVEVGGRDALVADLARVQVEVLRRREERTAAYQDYRVAAADLARLLRLDPQTPLVPVEDFRHPLDLPGADWLGRDLEALVVAALSNRPELAENQALVRAALDRVRAAQLRPLLPGVVLNYSAGGFGGGPNFLSKESTKGLGIGTRMTPSGWISDFGGRADFDVSLVWRLQNLGFGNQAEVREQRALQRQAELRQIQLQDRVVTQVVQAHELVQRGAERLDITRSALLDPKGQPEGPVYRSLRLNFDRIRGAEGRPLEVLDSIRGLNDLLEAYYQAMTDYERARFRLLIALGLPPETLLGTAKPPARPRP